MEKHITNALREALLNKLAQWKQTLGIRNISWQVLFTQECALQNLPDATPLLTVLSAFTLSFSKVY